MIQSLPNRPISGKINFAVTRANEVLTYKISKFYYFMLLFLLGLSNYGFSANVGDYQTKSTATTWNSINTWEIFNGSAWVQPSAAQGYPGYSSSPGTVTILTTHTVTLNVSPAYSIGNFVLIGTGKLTINTTGTYTVIISGNISFGTGPGSLFDPINMKDGTGIGVFNLNGAGLQTISGDAGGNCYFYQLYITGSGGVKLNHDIVVEGDLTVYSNRTFDISTFQCNKTSAPNCTYTLQSGATLKLSGSLGGDTGSNFPCQTGGIGTFGYNFDPASKVEYYGTAQTVSSKTNYGNLTLSGSGAKTISGITVINGILSMEGTTTTSGTVPTYGSGATLQYKGSAAQKTGIELPVTFSGSGVVIFTNTAGVTLGSSIKVNGPTQITPASSKLIIPPATCLNTTTITSTTDPNQILIQTSPTGTGGNGSLIFQNGLGSPVQATIEMYSKAACTNRAAKTGYKWQFFGIPVLSLTTASPTFDGGYVRKMNENVDPHWEQLSNASPLSAFTGYEITQLDPTLYTFRGQLVNGDHTVNLTYTTGKPYIGQNLIGNSYTAAINISKLIYIGNVINTVYIYNTGSYNDWVNAGSGTKSDSINKIITPGQYTAVPKNLAGVAYLPSQIPSMQAFLVEARASSTSLTIPYNSVVGTMVADTVPQRTKGMLTKAASEKIYSIIDVKGSRFSDRIWLFTEPNCTHSFDNGWDGEKFLGSSLAPQIFAMEADGDYQVNSVDDINNTYLGFLAGEDSLYTLTFTHQNLGIKYAKVYLVDSIGQQTVDITPDSSKYTFRSLPTDTITRRFKIITNYTDVTTHITTPTSVSTRLNVFSSNKSVYIDNKSDEKGILYLYDMTGRIIQNYNFIAQGITTIQTNVSPGNYLVKVITKNRSVTKNISLE